MNPYLQEGCPKDVRGQAVMDRMFNSAYKLGTTERKYTNAVVHCESKEQDCKNTRQYAESKQRTSKKK